MTLSWPTPDQLLAALLPIAILLITWRILASSLDQSSPQIKASKTGILSPNSLTISTPDPGFPLPRLSPLPPAHPLSLPSALNGFASYVSIASVEHKRMCATLAALPRASRRLALDAGYGRRLDALAEATRINDEVVRKITRLARERTNQQSVDVGAEGGGWEMMLSTLKGDNGGGEPGPGSIERVREALKHIVRDWSSEGSTERDTFHTPIVEALTMLLPPSFASPVSKSPLSSSLDSGPNLSSETKTPRPLILLPGAALSRLAHTLSSAPHNMHTHACELSAYPLVALRLLLDEKLTPKAECHQLHPWAHWFSHQRGEDVSAEGQAIYGKGAMRSVKVPDVVPRLSPHFQILEGDFLHVPAPSTGLERRDGYDAIVTLFFIDTSVDVVRTIVHIFSLLKPGGSWINLGPLLWTGGGGRAVELSLAEVLSVTRAVGFEIYEEGKNDLSSYGVKGEEEDIRRVLGRRVVRGEYTADRQAMMRWIYEAEFWVARKPLSASWV